MTLQYVPGGGILLTLFGPGTWGAGGNIVAWVICGALTAAGTWLARDRIGRRAAAWWDKHHGPHAVRRQRQALAEHEAEGKRG